MTLKLYLTMGGGQKQKSGMCYWLAMTVVALDVFTFPFALFYFDKHISQS